MDAKDPGPVNDIAMLTPAQARFDKLLFFLALGAGSGISFPVHAQTASAQEFQHPKFLEWARRKSKAVRAIDFSKASEYVRLTEPDVLAASPRMPTPISPQERARFKLTSQNYFRTFGRDRRSAFLWGGVESANPRTKDDAYRWDMLRVTRMYDRGLRARVIRRLRGWNIRVVRLGLPNHELSLRDPSTWKRVDAVMRDFSEAGIRISLDLHHFGIEDRFKTHRADGSVDNEHSYYLNPAWPAYYARFALFAVRRYRKSISAITLINEPEPTVSFNGQMWHGGFPGWDSPSGTKDRFAIKRALAIAKAALKVRLELERERSAGRLPGFVYVHNEGAVYKGYWPEYNEVIRFFPSDLILGQAWFLDQDLKALSRMPLGDLRRLWVDSVPGGGASLSWFIRQGVFGDAGPAGVPVTVREGWRRSLFAGLEAVKSLHRELKRVCGCDMRGSTLFGLDYYAQNEDYDSEKVHLSPWPGDYAEQVNSNRRRGLQNLMIDYFERFRVPLMIGESSTAYFPFAAKWNEQLLLDAAAVAMKGIPVLGFVLYPVVDTRGWEIAMSKTPEFTQVNLSGLVSTDGAVHTFKLANGESFVPVEALLEAFRF